jgi:hypothetical protein
VKVETVCVLTGDLVRSSALGEQRLDAVFDALAAAGDEVLGWAGGGRGPERFRGDGWQLLIAQPVLALRAMLRMRAAVRTADDRAETRIGAGIGPARAGTTLADGAGEAFKRSGRALDGLRTHRGFALAGAFDDARNRALADGMTAVCDALSQRWTARQSDVFARACGPDAPSLKAIAGQLDVTPQTVQSHFVRAGGPALIDAVEAFESAMVG